MEGLEWGWMIMKGSINLDSRSNVFFLGASMHQLFRDMKWVLLPESDVVVRYYDDDFLLDREDLPKIEGDVFKYIFVPIRDMEDIYVTRSSSEEEDGRITVYQYPLDNFPMITSHIHPKYAIFHAGEAISRYLDRPRKISLIQRYPWVQQVERLYRTWAGCLPAESKDDAIYNAIGSVMSHDSRSLDHTPLLRIRPLDPLDIPQQFVPTRRNTSNDYLSRTTAVNMPVRKSNRRK
ncbi:hypothetical protein BJ165DRAFT_562520 [Panaeolus papilionaceus]|nr:hypothetical protein BJ165DRAFT_562520 [Panaeolus papilionaceus]